MSRGKFFYRRVYPLNLGGLDSIKCVEIPVKFAIMTVNFIMSKCTKFLHVRATPSIRVGGWAERTIFAR